MGLNKIMNLPKVLRIAEIARDFRIPHCKIGDLERATYNNEEIMNKKKKIKIRFWKILANLTTLRLLISDIKAVVRIVRKISHDEELRRRINRIDSIVDELFG